MHNKRNRYRALAHTKDHLEEGIKTKEWSHVKLALGIIKTGIEEEKGKRRYNDKGA